MALGKFSSQYQDLGGTLILHSAQEPLKPHSTTGSSDVGPVLRAALRDCILHSVPDTSHHTGMTSPILLEWNVEFPTPSILAIKLLMHHSTADDVFVLR